jgi:hypothetical protein
MDGGLAQMGVLPQAATTPGKKGVKKRCGPHCGGLARYFFKPRVGPTLRCSPKVSRLSTYPQTATAYSRHLSGRSRGLIGPMLEILEQCGGRLSRARWHAPTR